jgi:hypothetical protein
MGARLTLEQLKKRVAKYSNGCKTLVGGFYEKGNPHRWHCGDIQPWWVKRNASPTGKRLCYECSINLRRCNKKIFKLEKDINNNDDNNT